MRCATAVAISLLGMTSRRCSPAPWSSSSINYPGMGLMFWQATQTPDFPILLATTTIVALATVIGSLLRPTSRTRWPIPVSD